MKKDDYDKIILIHQFIDLESEMSLYLDGSFSTSLLKLDEFNALPKVTPFFFEYNLRIRSRPQNPVVFRFQTELKLTAHKPTRYKYKLYSVEDRENGALNNYVFCQLKEDRLLGSFSICPPLEGMYYFKVYARPEWQMYEDTTLKNVAIFLLECLKAKKHVNPYPINDVPWEQSSAEKTPIPESPSPSLPKDRLLQSSSSSDYPSPSSKENGGSLCWPPSLSTVNSPRIPETTILTTPTQRRTRKKGKCECPL
ncbi:uncharacterized protein CEXT_244081 [Caerostris extrusa]|uniref:KY-like immunoglobulin-like domain-containing protein n=1 Tax=Caerostris extrusa TaxID=172846 RepID=A0AAV4PTN3_CAEEX|nr:uncharacterized protein CEXT_244081 [Caerostris extrusa]